MAQLLPEWPAVKVGAEDESASATAGRARRGGRALGFPLTAVERVHVVDEDGDLVALAVLRGFESSGSSCRGGRRCPRTWRFSAPRTKRA